MAAAISAFFMADTLELRYCRDARDWPPGPVWVVLPTYNERENLEPVVAGVRAALAAWRRITRILIVDDSSPDGTGSWPTRWLRATRQ